MSQVNLSRGQLTSCYPSKKKHVSWPAQFLFISRKQQVVSIVNPTLIMASHFFEKDSVVFFSRPPDIEGFLTTTAVPGMTRVMAIDPFACVVIRATWCFFWFKKEDEGNGVFGIYLGN